MRLPIAIGLGSGLLGLLLLGPRRWAALNAATLFGSRWMISCSLGCSLMARAKEEHSWTYGNGVRQPPVGWRRYSSGWLLDWWPTPCWPPSLLRSIPMPFAITSHCTGNLADRSGS